MAYNVQIDVDVSGASTLIDSVVRTLDTNSRDGLNRIGATAARTALQEYHVQFERARRWTNPSLSTHGSGRQKTRFGEDIARAWTVGAVSANGAEIINQGPYFAAKVRRVTIRPKRVSKLTIPVHPTAHGRLAGRSTPDGRVSWRALYGALWQPPGRQFLMGIINGRARVIYALKDQVVQKPWPGALPPENVYSEPYIEAIEKEIFRNL